MINIPQNAIKSETTKAAAKTVTEAAEALRHKPEIDYTFEDWYTKAFAAYVAEQFDEAVFYWSQVAKVEDAKDINIASTLYNKGVTLGKLKRFEEAIAVYDQLLKNYGPELQEEGARALANAVEMLLVLNQYKAAIARAQQAKAGVDNKDISFAIMPFLLWLAKAGTMDNILDAIYALGPEVAFDWNGDQLRNWIKQLPKPRRQQAECFMAYFETHHDIGQLEQCLGLK